MHCDVQGVEDEVNETRRHHQARINLGGGWRDGGVGYENGEWGYENGGGDTRMGSEITRGEENECKGHRTHITTYSSSNDSS